MSLPCKWCGSVEHTQFYCRRKPRKAIKRTPVKKIGKVTKQWIITRETWFKRNPARRYECYLCGILMTKAETTLDHVIPRSRAPELRFDMSNLRPCCLLCNHNKGSKTLDKLNSPALPKKPPITP